MAYTAIALTDPVSGYSVDFRPADGVTVTTLDIQPSVRAVAEERVGGAGQVDNTMWLSTCAVTLSAILWPGVDGTAPEEFLDAVGPLLGPWLRPALVCSNDQWAQQRQLTVRFDSKTGPVDNPLYTNLAWSFKAPNGIWEAATVTEAIIPAFIAATGGLAVTPVTGVPVTTSGLAVTAGADVGEAVAVAAGNMPVQWTASLYGPCTAPALANDTAGLVLEFTSGVVLAAGDYVALNSQNRTAIQSSTGESVLGSLNFAASGWWLMQPGVNEIRYNPVAAAAGAAAVIDFRPGWMP
jgi:hypothetical protein